MKRIQDPMGQAILDYWKTGRAEKIRVFSPMFEEDEMPVEILFRKYEDMPAIERHAMDISRGKILDVGAGAATAEGYGRNCHRHLAAIGGGNERTRSTKGTGAGLLYPGGAVRHDPAADERRGHRGHYGTLPLAVPSAGKASGSRRTGAVRLV